MIGQTMSTNGLGPARASPAPARPASTRAAVPPSPPFAGDVASRSAAAKEAIRKTRIKPPSEIRESVAGNLTRSKLRKDNVAAVSRLWHSMELHVQLYLRKHG